MLEMLQSSALNVSLILANANNNKKAVLPQGNLAMPKCSFLLKFANNIHYKYKTSQASKAATLQSSKHADA